MIVKIMSAGKSFKGLGTYLTRDPDAETEKRVAWSHTLNLANDHIPSAIDEMLWTSRNAELLKQEAGIRAGGRATENSVKHISLNWSPDDNPSRNHMIETTEEFLQHMRWSEHQAVLIAHNDKEHSHVHVMLNAIHPETGLKLDEGFEHRRSQAWALEYERQQENIRCENRLKGERDREASPTRPAWMAFKEEQRKFEENEKNLAAINLENKNNSENQKSSEAREWEILKDYQREQRLSFFANGKIEFSDLRKSIYGEVREEFRERWREYYSAEKNGELEPEKLKEVKAGLVAEQASTLAERRDEACADLRTSRNEHYRELLGNQAEMRHGLHWRQEAGLSSEDYLAAVTRGETTLVPGFKEAGNELTMAECGYEQTGVGREDGEAREATVGRSTEEDGDFRPGVDIGVNVGVGLGFGLLSFFDSIADGIVGSSPAPKPRAAESEGSRSTASKRAADDDLIKATREREAAERREREEEWSRARD